jgi:hypothetical protein
MTDVFTYFSTEYFTCLTPVVHVVQQEEVVLLLIQVRRLLAQLNAMKDFYNESLLKTDR